VSDSRLAWPFDANARGAGAARPLARGANGDQASVIVSAGSGTASSLAMLNAISLEHLLPPTPPPLRGAIVAGLSRAAVVADRVA
jgi:hypothetical protein